MGEPALSVVIPTRDRSAVLATTLALLDEQHALPGGFEVIVVDDGSSDGTGGLLAGARPAGYPLRCLRQPPSGPAAARNRGVAVAAAPRVLLLGDDTLPDPGTLAAHLGAAAGRRRCRVASSGTRSSRSPR